MSSLSLQVVNSSAALDLQSYFEVLPPKDTIGWLGADADFTVAIAGSDGSGKPSRLLWVFSDTVMTYYLPETNQRDISGFSLPMPHNSIAIVDNCTSATDLAGVYCQGPPRFMSRYPNSFFEVGGNTTDYLWPMSGVSTEDGERVLLLACQSTERQVCNASASIRIDNCSAASPFDWSYVTAKIPYTSMVQAATSGFSCCGSISKDPTDPSMVYLLGAISGQTVIARSRLDDLLDGDWSRLEFSRGLDKGWSPSIAYAAPNNLPVTTETTITFDGRMGLWYMFLIVNYPTTYKMLIFYSSSIAATVWKNTTVMESIPEPFNNGSYVCYAAKAHPEYISPTSGDICCDDEERSVFQLECTWICNPLDMDMLFSVNSMKQGLRSYWPQFLSVQVMVETVSPDIEESTGEKSDNLVMICVMVVAPLLFIVGTLIGWNWYVHLKRKKMMDEKHAPLSVSLLEDDCVE